MDVPRDDEPLLVLGRRNRQRVEILGLISRDQLHRAADLAHEHLAEFADDGMVRMAVVEALEHSRQRVVRRRANEFPSARADRQQPPRQRSESDAEEDGASPTGSPGATKN